MNKFDLYEIVFNLLLALFRKKFGKSGGFLEKSDLTANVDAVKFQPDPVRPIGGSVKKTNPWLDHVKTVKDANPGLAYKEVLKKAKETYKKQGSALHKPMTTHDYKTVVQDPIKTQAKLLKTLPPKTGKPRGRPRKVVVDQESSKGKPVVSKVEGIVKNAKKLKVEKYEEPTKDSPIKKLRFEKPQPQERKYKDEPLEDLIKYKTRKEEARKPDAPAAPAAQPSEPVGEVEEGSGLSLEALMLKEVKEKIKDIPIVKQASFIKKYLESVLKVKKIKPIIRNQIIKYVQSEIEKLHKGGAVDKPKKDKKDNKLAKEIVEAIPKTYIAEMIDSLEKSGIFKATDRTLNVLIDELVKVLNAPGSVAKRSMITRDIPNLQFTLDKLRNERRVYGDTWTDFKKRSHKLAILNTKSHITALLNRVAGITLLEPSKDEN